MIVGKTCNDCKHYIDRTYFEGHCSAFDKTKTFNDPVGSCDKFLCIAYAKSICKQCRNKHECY